jgi:rod shape-determining protein MreC
MRNFYLFFLKYKDHFIFLFIVFFSSFLLLQNDNPNIHIIRGKVSDKFSIITTPLAWYRSMIRLENETHILREKNIQLSLKIESMLNANDEYKSLLKLLKLKDASNLELIAANVINSGSSANLSSVTIDIGSNDGIKLNQTVLVSEGVIGKTVVVGNNSSIVQIINDVNFRLSVRVLPSGNSGILRFLKDDICEIRELQKNSEISIGDNVVTSGFSQIYPKNLPVGEVIEVVNERGSFQKVAKVRIKAKIGSLLHVFVIINDLDQIG